jgi:hypothetical protein
MRVSTQERKSQKKIEKDDRYKKECLMLITQGKDKPLNKLGSVFDKLCDPTSSYFDSDFLDLIKHLAPKWLEKPIIVKILRGQKVYTWEGRK